MNFEASTAPPSHGLPRLHDLLRLCRFPAVFTALADIFAGFALSREQFAPLNEFFPLLGASAGLYLAGMVFNDVFDIAQDTRERPGRPIPSGAVSLGQAIAFGSLLLAAGLSCAALAGIHSLLTALVLTGCIFAYDSYLKRTPLGPVAMGSCRFFNILLGGSAAATTFPEVFRTPQLWIAAAMGVYVAGITWFARREALVSRRSQLIAALVTINTGLLMLGAWMLNLTAAFGIPPPDPFGWMLCLSIYILVIVQVNQVAIWAIRDPVPNKVQPTIGAMLGQIIDLNAMVIISKGLGFAWVALVVVLFLFPVIWLKKRIPMT